LEKENPKIKNGMARPKEKKVRKIIPVFNVLANAANVRIAARTGPIHGSHVIDKTAPKTKEPIKGILFFICIRGSFKLKERLTSPRTFTAINKIKIPPMMRKIFRFFNTNVPNDVAVAPKTTNTNEKPRIKTIVSLNKNHLVLSIVSNDFPVIKVKYIGIKGIIHGLKKARNPPKKLKPKPKFPCSINCSRKCVSKSFPFIFIQIWFYKILN
jgi:hypothetical protein